ncbi:hypothetical protein Ahu01nite_097880 [Winogradskya humida]|uniref:ATP-dependent Clp protease proteolytic subunit n=2 Tax=Winogradskya humida TaxID=113566 RepID=A0ABQ4A752_9ACTN|nr:hypothetical protein Ahu01nite_097880 [Actinoplanes humidus]
MFARGSGVFGAPRDQPPEWYHIGPVFALAESEDPSQGEDAGGSRADVYLYGTIGGWFGVSADSFVRDVASLDVDHITLHINSQGGAAQDGMAIGNIIRGHRAHVIASVDGMCASAASAAAMFADEVVMRPGSQMMVHDPWGFASGNAADVRKYADSLDSTSNAYAAVYAARAGGTTEEWRDIMRAESWYTAEEAVEAGLADRIGELSESGYSSDTHITPGRSGGFWDMWDSLSAADRHDLSAYMYAGREQAPAPRIPARQTPAASARRQPNTQEGSTAVAFSPEQLTTMRSQLGLADNADESAIVAALGQRLNEPAAPQTPPGTVVVDEAQHEQLVADARDGREARAQQLAERRAGLVQAAIDDGRIPRARREHWLEQLKVDPGSESTLANLKPGLVPLAEIGYATKNDGAPDPAASDDYWFAGIPAPSVKG